MSHNVHCGGVSGLFLVSILLSSLLKVVSLDQQEDASAEEQEGCRFMEASGIA